MQAFPGEAKANCQSNLLAIQHCSARTANDAGRHPTTNDSALIQASPYTTRLFSIHVSSLPKLQRAMMLAWGGLIAGLERWSLALSAPLSGQRSDSLRRCWDFHINFLAILSALRTSGITQSETVKIGLTKIYSSVEHGILCLTSGPRPPKRTGECEENGFLPRVFYRFFGDTEQRHQKMVYMIHRNTSRSISSSLVTRTLTYVGILEKLRPVEYKNPL